MEALRRLLELGHPGAGARKRSIRKAARGVSETSRLRGHPAPLGGPYVSLIPAATSRMEPLCAAVLGSRSNSVRPEERMLDLLYLALGVVVFALFGAYAVGLRRI